MIIIYSQRNDTSFSENTYKTNLRNAAWFLKRERGKTTPEGEGIEEEVEEEAFMQ